MKKILKVLMVATCLSTPIAAAMADSAPANPSALERNPWDKFSLSLGAFLANTNTGIRVGSGLGLDVDVEDTLGLDSQAAALRAETYWRFTSNRKHRLDASWFALRRKAKRQIGQDFDIKDQDGNTVTIQAGSEVSSHFNLNIIETAYSYSFIQDDRLDLAVSGGVYIMPINFGLEATGVTNANGKLKFTAPLPVAGLRMDVAMTRKWFLRTGAQLFAIDYQNFSGSLTQVRGAVEYLPFRHLGVGVGVDSMRFRMQAKGEDYPSIDMRGNVDFQYVGAQLYGKLFF